jgi:hypothetical protein
VSVRHAIPEKLGEQLIHVTLKGGADAKRIERQVLTVQGTGELQVTFDVHEQEIHTPLRFAAFIGKDYANNLQHVSSPPVPVR